VLGGVVCGGLLLGGGGFLFLGVGGGLWVVWVFGVGFGLCGGGGVVWGLFLGGGFWVLGGWVCVGVVGFWGGFVVLGGGGGGLVVCCIGGVGFFLGVVFCFVFLFFVFCVLFFLGGVGVGWLGLGWVFWFVGGCGFLVYQRQTLTGKVKASKRCQFTDTRGRSFFKIAHDLQEPTAWHRLNKGTQLPTTFCGRIIPLWEINR